MKTKFLISCCLLLSTIALGSCKPSGEAVDDNSEDVELTQEEAIELVLDREEAEFNVKSATETDTIEALNCTTEDSAYATAYASVSSSLLESYSEQIAEDLLGEGTEETVAEGDSFTAAYTLEEVNEYLTFSSTYLSNLIKNYTSAVESGDIDECEFAFTKLKGTGNLEVRWTYGYNSKDESYGIELTAEVENVLIINAYNYMVSWVIAETDIIDYYNYDGAKFIFNYTLSMSIEYVLEEAE